MRVRLLCVAATLLAATLAACPAPAEAAGCAALDYQAGLASASTALQRTPPDPAGARAQVATLLGADPGSAVALQPVLDDLAAAPPLVADAQLRLTSMSATLAYPRGSVCNENADAASSKLHSVYASPDFRHLDDSAQPGLLTRILSAIGDLLRGATGALGPAGTLGLAIAILGLALLLSWRRWQGSAPLRGARFDEAAEAGDDPEAEWRAAQRAAAAGDHREAVRRAFRSALLEVALRGNLHIDSAWTTRELLQRCHADGEVLAALAAAAARFERAWYSGTAVTAADWTRAEEGCATVRRLARHAGVEAR
ncbi:MAG TPA: DUF4129 domain-containing protein [Candidatus Dormibacteraeota bacterium]|jgi:hypothetical protein|nr:DUF4129 domain-containing protein [Candidatus Dormibacteraeota bacterium]